MAGIMSKSVLFALLNVAFSSITWAASVSNGTVAIPACTSLNQRKSWTDLTDDEKHAYIDAELCLINSPAKLGTVEGAITRWDEVMWVHITQSNIMHDTGSFLPWHRLYVRAHEILLQTECNYTGAQPYWNEQETVLDMAAGIPYNASDVFDPDTGFGGDGAGDDECVADGPFANLTLHLNHTSNFANYCLSRSFNEAGIETANSTYLDACFESEDYAAAWLCYKAKPHTAGHAGVGGTMLEAVASPGDPLFFLHHTNLDRLWWEWQQVNLSSRLTDMNGRTVPLESFLEANDVPYPSDAMLHYDGDWPHNETTLHHNLWMVGLIPNGTVGDVMDIRNTTICAEYI